MKNLITIDGPAASGKTTVGILLAKLLSWNFVSTGIFYRGISYFLLKENKGNLTEDEIFDFLTKNEASWKVSFVENQACFFLKEKKIDLKDLRLDEISELASKISQFEKIRKHLLSHQRALLDLSKLGLVAEGRDCGSVVFEQESSLKVYLDASESLRAKRRQKENSGVLKKVQKQIKERDSKDQKRSFGRLVVPEGALKLDSSFLSPEKIASLIFEKFKKL